MKKVFTHLLTVVLLILVVLLTIIILGRILLAGDNVYNIVKDNINEKIGGEEIEEGVLKNFLEEDAEGISNYINENEFDEEFGNIISAYFKYTAGISDEKPDLNKFEKVIKEATIKYEQETGKKVDEKKIDQALSTMNKVIKETKPAKINKKVKVFLNFIYSDTSLTIIVLLILFDLALIYLLNKTIIAVIKSTAIVTSINTIFLFILSFIISQINNEEILSVKTLKYFTKLSRNTAIIYLLTSIILIVILVINKKTNKTKKTDEIVEE